MDLPETLWHYACKHTRQAIGDEGVLVPMRALLGPDMEVPWTGELVWLTDLSVPIRDALGLTQTITKCDRTEYRYRVTDTSHVLPWIEVRKALPRGDIHMLEDDPGARPRHWYVTTVGTPVVFDDPRHP